MLTNNANCAFHNIADPLNVCTSSGVAVGETCSVTASMGSRGANGIMHVASWWWHHVHVRVLFSVLLKHPARYCNA